MQAILPLQVQRALQGLRQRLQRAVLSLDLLDPRMVLQRGFAWVSDGQGQAVSCVRSLAVEQPLRVHMADGQVDVKVTQLHEEGPH
jgi:exodeoxyribonuclease VII large subunit